jgi:hypothetical protein
MTYFINSFTDTTGWTSPHKAGGGGGGDEEHAAASAASTAPIAQQRVTRTRQDFRSAIIFVMWPTLVSPV